MAKSITRIVLHAPKAIARDPDRPGVPIFTDSGTELAIPSLGVSAKMRNAWLKDGSAAAVDEIGDEASAT
jgi:hypothetical protein